MINIEIYNEAKEIVKKLNKKFGQNIFGLKENNSNVAVIKNYLYRYEGNDVDIHIFDENLIIGTISGLTVNFDSYDDIIDNIDEIFICG